MKDIQELLAQTAAALEKLQSQAQQAFSKISLYKAHPSMVDTIPVDYHGVATPLQQVATITTPNTTTLEIAPWDKKMLHSIEKAIVQHKGQMMTPHQAGDIIRVQLPVLTEELRTKIVKNITKAAEGGKVHIRTERQQRIKALQKMELSEDEVAKGKKALQTLIDKYSEQIDQLRQKKEQEVMKI